MDRRELLKTGAVLGTAAIAGTQTGCASVPGIRAEDLPRPLRDMNAYLARLDEDLAGIGQLNLTKDLDPKGALPALPRLLQEKSDLAQKAARTLYLTATFRDLSEEERLHPGVQARLRSALPEMDEAVLGMSQLLTSMSEDERAQLQKTMQQNPELVQRAVSVLEDQLEKPAVDLERRRRLQAATHRFAWQMQHQSLSALVDECVEKAERAAAEAGAGDPRWVAARIGEDNLRRYQLLAAKMQADAGAGAEVPAVGGEVPPPEEEQESVEDEQIEPEEEPEPSKPPPPVRRARTAAPAEEFGQSTMNFGARTMGIGAIGTLGGLVLLVVGGAGGSALSFIATLGAIGTTVGGILLMVGLLIVIVGAIAHSVS